MRVSALVVARNEEARLPGCLAALAPADELVVVLDRSTDNSAQLARAAGVKSVAIIHLHPAHSDTTLHAMEADLQAEMPSAFIAREQQSVVVGAERADLPADLHTAPSEARRRIRVA